MNFSLKENKFERNSNIEILRIISMLLIVGYHMITNGLIKPNYLIYSSGTIFNKITSLIFFPAGRIGVMLFFMITGYFLIEKDSSSAKKVIIKTAYYCILLNILFIFSQYFFGIYGKTLSFNWKTYLQKNMLIPFSSGMHWFCTNYIILVIFLPVINKFLRKLSIKGFLIFLFIANFFWYGLGYYFSVNYYYLYETLFFYSCGAFFKFFISKKKFKKYFLILLFFVCYFVAIILSKIIFTANLENNVTLAKMSNYFLRTIFIPIIGFLLFMIFNSLKIKNSKTINFLASKSLDVYLLHGSIFQTYLWSVIFNIKSFYKSNFFIVYLLASIFAIFMISTFLGYLSDKFFISKINKFVDNLWIKIKHKIIREEVNSL